MWSGVLGPGGKAAETSTALLLRVLVAQHVLDDLAAGVAGNDVDGLELLGDLLHHQTLVLEEVDHLLELERVPGVLQRHDRAAALPQRRIGQPDHSHVGDLVVGVEEVLDLLGADVLALADDHVLQAPGDDDVALGVDEAEVAGPEEALLVEGLGVERRVEIAATDLWALGPDPAFLARARYLAV